MTVACTVPGIDPQIIRLKLLADSVESSSVADIACNKVKTALELTRHQANII